MVVIGIVILILAAVLIVVGALATTRKLPGNSVVGLRVEEVRKSREAWDAAHAVAGPVWFLGGVALAFGGIVALTATGWMWLIPVATAIIAVITLSVGANLGARSALLWDQANNADEGCGDSCNCGSGGCGSDTAAEAAPAQIDLDAVRQAANRADQ
ncbi:SdpI family protein [Corynebacterium sp. 32222D000AT]|uniref:SdpI family protein n=1 Tax=unclassified Corynebacterium TaxID=2624378 RepID=UPI002A97A86B|nr:SdpI family protein [Mycobacteriaceae bacterium]MDY5829224.1 SdpI family protein [Corynebacterium sp.]